MKNFLLFFVFLFTTLAVNAQDQISILFVDDSDDTFGNAERFHEAIDSLGYESTYFDAVGNDAGPTSEEMENYDLVIWTTASDGVNLYFWDAMDQDNGNLKDYLDNGGKLWVVGLDLLYDRYGSAPASFAPDDFVYDYLGLASYDAQSYGDDGGLGLPEASPNVNSEINGLNTLTWTFATLWWVDAVTSVETASSIYLMGDENYVFAGETCGVYYNNGGDFEVLSYFFDLSQVADFEMLKQTVQPVLEFFEGQVLSSSDLLEPSLGVQVYPNPTNGLFAVDFENIQETINLRVLSVAGKVITNERFRNISTLQIELDQPNGMYFLELSDNQGKKVILRVVKE